MKVANSFAKLLSYVLIILFSFVCLIAIIFLIIKNMTNYESINQYVKNANIFDYSSTEISNNDNNTIRQTIEKDMLKFDIPVLVTDEVLDSQEINAIVSDYIYNYSRYIIFNFDRPKIPTDEIVVLFENKYYMQEYKKISKRQKTGIEKYIETLGAKVNDSIFSKNEINQIIGLNKINQVAILFDSHYVVISFAILLTILLIMIYCCQKEIKKTLRWCSKAIMFDGMLLIALSFVEVRLLIMYFNSQGLIDNLAILIVEKGFENMLIYGGILIAIGIILMIVSSVLLRKENRKKSKKILDETITSEIENQVKEKETEINSMHENKDDKKEPIKSTKENDKPEVNNYELDKQNSLDITQKDETQIVPLPEDEIATNFKEPTPIEEAKIEYKELHDEVKEELITNFVPRQLDNMQINIVHPKKGEEITPNNDEQDDDIEIL